MRSNSASELCTSIWTPSRPPIGKNNRVCSVVNATSVPIVDRVAARLRPAREPVDERRHHGERHLDRGHHPAAGHPASHLEVGQAPRLVGEPRREVVGAPHRLAEQDPRDRERLLHDRRDIGERDLTLGGHLLPLRRRPASSARRRAAAGSARTGRVASRAGPSRRSSRSPWSRSRAPRSRSR